MPRHCANGYRERGIPLTIRLLMRAMAAFFRCARTSASVERLWLRLEGKNPPASTIASESLHGERCDVARAAVVALVPAYPAVNSK